MPFNVGGYIYNGEQANTQDYYNVITRGLVLHLDASAPSSYPGSGTTWSDISGNSHVGTLTNGPTFSTDGGGSIVFDGTNDYVTIPDSSNWDFGTGEFSIEMWIYLDGAQPANYSGYIGTFQSKWPASGWVIMNSPGTNMRSYSNDGTYETTISTNVTLSQWNHIVLTKVSNTGYMYVNGTSIGTQDWTSRAFDNTGNPLLIGAGSADYSKIKMASVKIYKGVGFTSAMVLQNFSIQRSRFGI